MRAKKPLLPYFVYIALCADNTLYVGITTDLTRRLAEHNSSKKGAKYTKARRPVTFRYSETCATKGEALKREYEIKCLKREDKLKLLAT